MNKYILPIVLIAFLSGCAHGPMQFRSAGYKKTQADYERARIECGGDSDQGNYFLFGPLFILAPVFAVIESINFAERHRIQDCLEAKGFKCINNCPHRSTIKP